MVKAKKKFWITGKWCKKIEQTILQQQQILIQLAQRPQEPQAPPIQCFESVVLPIGEPEQTAKKVEAYEKAGFFISRVYKERDAFWQSQFLLLKRPIWYRLPQQQINAEGGLA